MKSCTLYRRLWYVKKRNIKKMQTVCRILVALFIFAVLMSVLTIRQLPVLINLQ